MMKPQVSDTGQSSGPNDQKKSVFDRLGHQLATGRPMKRRPSPGQYLEYMSPPPMQEAEFGRHLRYSHAQAEMDWRYHNERRHMQFSRDRHQSGQLQQPLPQPPPHYEIEMEGRQPLHYPHTYHGGQPNSGLPLPPPPPMGLGNMQMNMFSQRSSPKYDRHGNIIMNFKESRGPPLRMGSMDHHQVMSPPRGFMPPGPIILGPNDMPPMRPGSGYMRPDLGHGWPHDGPMENPDFLSIHNRMAILDDRFSSRRLQQQQQQQQIMSVPGPNPHGPNPLICEAPRYAKWRERRDVITNLDKETAQSSSRTDSLKYSLQQEIKTVNKVEKAINNNSGFHKLNKQKAGPPQKQQSGENKSLAPKSDILTDVPKLTTEIEATAEDSMSSRIDVKSESQEISDGEIVDDEDSSDDSESIRANIKIQDGELLSCSNYSSLRLKGIPIRGAHGNKNREPHQYYESSGKKRQLLEREDYSMDYETISDEDLDDFMGDKKIRRSASNCKAAKLDDGRAAGDEGGQSLSEVELLNALGLDWANLVEMARQSRASKEISSPGFGLSRFQMSNYLSTLGITVDLAGPKLYDLISRICRLC